MKKIVIIELIFLLFFAFVTNSFSPVRTVYAQNVLSSGIATYVQIKDNNVQEGSIVSVTHGGYVLTKTAYDSSVFGVVVTKPAIAFEITNQKNTYPVVSAGKVYVRVSTNNGAIKEGDFITTSTTPGVGQKAIDNGFIIGTATEDLNIPKGKIEKILVILDVGHTPPVNTATTNLLNIMKLALSATYITPLNSLRYVFAALLVLGSFTIGVWFFGRASNTGIEAIGRNPLAGRLIILSVLLHLSLAFVMISSGIVMAYLILVL